MRKDTSPKSSSWITSDSKMESGEVRLANRESMRRGELYYAFTPDLIAARSRCSQACRRFNNAGDVSRRRLVELWKDIIQDKNPLPPPKEDSVEDEVLLEREPWIEAPIRMDYGFNVRLGEGVFINANCFIIDTCLVTIGARTLFGPNVHLYSGTHPLDPAVRNGTQGPELGKEIHIGATIGAGSVVTKDVPAFHLAVGNPAKVIRKIETSMADS
ncbi:trimeric LpxA-like protein [Aspergillus leporis]|uniref:Trimeric LpxA-like protein n=1 Tax=Aspergillus leporis TaxID=41062 RepID=A0A5N5XFX2_9EURO|nr:trimeric LpxA-like protein [Aspergillus leporis]